MVLKYLLMCQSLAWRPRSHSWDMTFGAASRLEAWKILCDQTLLRQKIVSQDAFTALLDDLAKRPLEKPELDCFDPRERFKTERCDTGVKQLAYEEGSGEPTLPRMQPAKGVQFPLVLCGSLMNFEKWDYSTVRYSCSHSSHGNFVATASDTFYTVTLVTGIWDLWHHGLLSKVGEPGSKHFLDFDRLDLLCTAREATETSQGAVETETKPVAEGRDSNWMWLRKALQASSHKEYLRAGETPLTTFCFTSTWLQVWCGAC